MPSYTTIEIVTLIKPNETEKEIDLEDSILYRAFELIGITLLTKWSSKEYRKISTEAES